MSDLKPCLECERQRKRANEAALRAASMADDLARHYRLRPELESVLGVAGLEGDAQMIAALARVAALEAVAEAARKIVVIGGTSARNTTSSIMACYRTDAIALEDALDALGETR